ncbi:hypothetical protein LDENG_00248370 [Lucifuga dentata]|nr:hypothetical protein LDENG_00248370 [Lucifuga dentata]
MPDLSPLPLSSVLPINISNSIFPSPPPFSPDPEPHCHTNNSLGTLTLLVSAMTCLARRWLHPWTPAS